MVIFLVGYGGHCPTRLLEIADEQNALVFDIRLQPYSKQPGWNGADLALLIGDRYVGLPQWGNKARITKGPMELMDWEGGLKRFKLFCGDRRPSAAILLCQCRSITECHRAMVGRKLAIEERYAVYDLHHWTKPDQAQLIPLNRELTEVGR